ncbi:hypothetical protein [Leifsonia sp. Root112D2]|jgi:hypothetical protein|uniref:hypothetical protein n=1 Tax=Leifsonia sp. Root112D2 TaxID=1736426 RepID=UPI0007010792|nr:hypothetical protein [Leifsonia sp. Root112D2]KQV08093.1 hypothetical protein ASC63_13180 [Leifsonia sp. Root112D2]
MSDQHQASASVSAARALPQLGAWVPGYVLRIAYAVTAAIAALLQFPLGSWLYLALLVALVGALRPRTLAPWFFLAMTGLSMLWAPPNTHSAAFFALLALGHLTHVFAARMLAVPARARLQLRSLARPLLHFAVIQATTQLLAVLVAVLLPGSSGASAVPLIGVIAALALLALAFVLITPLLRHERRDERR